MVTIKFTNTRANIVGRLSDDPVKSTVIQEELRKELGYQPPGYEWSPKFQEGLWDGWRSLFSKRDQSYPTGLTRRVTSLLTKHEIPYEIEDWRQKPERRQWLTSNLAAMGRSPFDYQAEAVRETLKATRGIIQLGTGAGKCLDVNTPVRTLHEWKTIGDVVDGDVLFDEQGCHTNVVKVHDVIHNKICYEILFSNGEKIVACDEHLWTIRIAPGWITRMPQTTLSTQEMYDVMHCGKNIKAGYYQRNGQRSRDVTQRSPFFIEAPLALDLGDGSDLPINPYILGAWLGDGGQNGNHFTSIDSEVPDLLQEKGLRMHRSSFKGYQEWNVQGLSTTLRSLGLFRNKRIPTSYQNAGMQQRKELLQGLMDTDGTIGTRGNSELSLSDEPLASDALSLIRSLGIQATITTNEAWLNGVRHKDRHRIKFTTRQQVALLPRKAERLQNAKERPTTRRIYIKSITPVLSRPVRCLTVDSPSRLYLVGKALIPTHNTIVSSELICQLQVAPIVFIVPRKFLLGQTIREFKKYIRGANGEEIKIGIIGDSKCDINFEGVNVVMWQTALQAFDESYDSTKDSIQPKENAGERQRKTTKELSTEYSEALVQYECDSKAWDAKHPLSESATEKEARAHDRERAKDLRTSKALLTKTQTALDTRKEGIARKAEIMRLFGECKAMIVDEAHLAAVVVEALGNHAPQAYYRAGLSATPWREDGQEIRIEGTMGRKLIEVSPSDLIEMTPPRLVPPTIFMLNIKHKEKATNAVDSYDKHIIHGDERNGRIKECAEAFFAEKRPTMILVDRIEHGKLLEAMIENAEFMPGSDKGDDDDHDPSEDELSGRERFLNRVARCERIGIATNWAGTGVDIPELEVLILGGAVASSATLYQFIGRVLRSCPQTGKDSAVVIDFWDLADHLRGRSVSRWRVYTYERAWKTLRIG